MLIRSIQCLSILLTPLVLNINWSYIVRYFTPTYWRGVVSLTWLEVLISPVKSLHADFITWTALQDRWILHNGQTIYLEKLLNDLFDNVNRGIYIDTVADNRFYYLFNVAEARQPNYLYNMWNASTAYVVDDRIAYDGAIYRCTIANTGLAPVAFPANWIIDSSETYLYNTAELMTLNDFIVYVPVSVTATQTDVRAIVNRYKVAGKLYTIQTY